MAFELREFRLAVGERSQERGQPPRSHWQRTHWRPGVLGEWVVEKKQGRQALFEFEFQAQGRARRHDQQEPSRRPRR